MLTKKAEPRHLLAHDTARDGAAVHPHTDLQAEIRGPQPKCQPDAVLPVNWEAAKQLTTDNSLTPVASEHT